MKSNRIPEDIKDSYCQICMEYTVYIRECIRDAMEAEYGDRAFEVLKAIDRARVSALRSSGQAALTTVPQNSGIDSFEQLDLYACTKMLCYLPEVQERLRKRYGLDERRFRLMQTTCKDLFHLRNRMLHSAK